MRGLAILGVVLIVAALVALFAGGFSYTEEETADLGPVDITVTERERTRIPTGVSIGVLVLGVILLAAAGRRRTV